MCAAHARYTLHLIWMCAFCLQRILQLPRHDEDKVNMYTYVRVRGHMYIVHASIVRVLRRLHFRLGPTEPGGKYFQWGVA